MVGWFSSDNGRKKKNVEVAADAAALRAQQLAAQAEVMTYPPVAPAKAANPTGAAKPPIGKGPTQP